MKMLEVADFRVGSLATKMGSPRHVRSTPDSDRWADIAWGPKSARTRLMHHGELLYSITSSASASSVGGISRLSAFAVLRLITRSNLVGCMTGRSAGFSPLRTRPT